MCTQLASTLTRSLIRDADAEFRLEQHAASERDLVDGRLIFARRSGVDGDPEPRPDVDSVAELRRQSDRRIAGVAGGIERTEHIGLQRRLPMRPPRQPTGHRRRFQCRSCRSAARRREHRPRRTVRRRGPGRRRRASGDSDAARAIFMARSMLSRIWCRSASRLPRATAALGASSIHMLSVRLSRMTNSGTSSRTSSSPTDAHTGSRGQQEPEAHHGDVGHRIEHAVAGIAERGGRLAIAVDHHRRVLDHFPARLDEQRDEEPPLDRPAPRDQPQRR